MRRERHGPYTSTYFDQSPPVVAAPPARILIELGQNFATADLLAQRCGLPVDASNDPNAITVQMHLGCLVVDGLVRGRWMGDDFLYELTGWGWQRLREYRARASWSGGERPEQR
jgi:hypothetical protein